VIPAAQPCEAVQLLLVAANLVSLLRSWHVFDPVMGRELLFCCEWQKTFLDTELVILHMSTALPRTPQCYLFAGVSNSHHIHHPHVRNMLILSILSIAVVHAVHSNVVQAQLLEHFYHEYSYMVGELHLTGL
jgi:hypothetical protein